ncbi:NAD(P)H:quinone oxidoreductase [Pseudomonas sp. gcc21]|uniref:NAD(P)H:quinone oxidoreductase n=1 Tax=Pseudomonas sp. gcc21 TaxID=2726989 RepID=UPI0014510D8A|nr:NAD(P)H:quinone oxidoreductase [Pseudomonas sp. gcc21]QJD57462.1 NAD(P)H:quinone oxidoreductase [Pseudomonas sp. gcc21]
MNEAKITIVVDSRYGSTLTLAQAIAAGAADAGAEVRLCRVDITEPEFSIDTGRADFLAAQAEYRALPRASAQDLEWATGIIWGSPTRYGLMSTPLRAFIDEIAPLWRQGALIGKVGAAFTSTGGMHSGNEMTLLALLMPFMQHGMIIAGVPHSVPALVRTRSGGSPYGASAVTGFDGALGVDAGEKAIARALGARVARLAGQITPEPASVELAASAAESPEAAS